MSAPDEDFVQKSRSIFERLRAEQDGQSPDGDEVTPGPVESASQPQESPSPGRDSTDENDRSPSELVGDGLTEADGQDSDRADPASDNDAGGEQPSPGDPAIGEVHDPLAIGELQVAPHTESETEVTEPSSESPSRATEDTESSVLVEDLPGADDVLSVTTAQPGEELVAGEFGAVEGRGGADTAVLDAAPSVDAATESASEPAAAPPEPANLPDPERFRRPLPRVLAIANQKGGVGKTTTTVNLGASLAVLGYRVLVVDLDPQGNATTGLGINSRNLEASIYDVILHDTPLEDAVEPTSLRNLFVAPATIDLAGAEIELVPAFSRELRLRRALEEVRDNYDFVLIDCPPSLGLLTVNALSAASEVVVPIQCEYYALEGLGQLLRNINLVQANLNPTLELSAIILTMYDARTKLAEQVADEVRQHFGDRVCRNVVPRTVRLSEAPSFGQPIIVFDPSSRGALAYRELAKEVSGGAPQRTG